MTTRKRSKARVYIYRVFVLSIVSLTLYGAYQGYEYLKPTVNAEEESHCLDFYFVEGYPTEQFPDHLTRPCKSTDKEINEIMNSQAFKAKAQNLAEQQLLQSKIDKKKAEILAMQNEVGTLQSELETKRNAGLSL